MQAPELHCLTFGAEPASGLGQSSTADQPWSMDGARRQFPTNFKMSFLTNFGDKLKRIFFFSHLNLRALVAFQFKARLRTMRTIGVAVGVCAMCVGCSDAFAPLWGGALSLQSGRTPAPLHLHMTAKEGGGNQKKWTVPEGYMPANRALSGRNSAMTSAASFEAALSAPSFDSRPRATTPIIHSHASQAADSRADSASTTPHQYFCKDGKKWSPPVGYVPQPKSANRDAEYRKRLAVELRDESIPQEEEDSPAALILDTYAPAGEFCDLPPRTPRAFHLWSRSSALWVFSSKLLWY